MNPIYRAGAETAQHVWVMGAMTVLFLACFLGWTWWAFARGNRSRMDEAALLPLTVENDA